MARTRKIQARTTVPAVLTTFALLAAGCGSDDDGAEVDSAQQETVDSAATGDDTEEAVEESNDEPAPDAGTTINVAIVGNPQMEDIVSLTPEQYTADSGIAVEYTILEEQTLREIVTREAGAEGDTFDVVMIGAYEAPQFGDNGWILNLNDFADGDADYAKDDILPTVLSALSVDGNQYASPFYAESSFVMYRADLLEAAGQTMPDAPTWDEVAEIARAVDSDETAGICLRGKPGWGDLGASFTTVLNTFGGTWWEANEDGTIGAAQVDQPEFREALEFYVSLAQDAGEPDAANSSFGECLSLYQDGKVAMWYDATVASGILEADDSPVQGQNGFALAPVKETDGSGWFWSWSLAIPQNAANADAAWDYISWATGPQYLETAGEELGWAQVPPGTRQSLYDNSSYQEASANFGQQSLDAILNANPDDPGTTPRPGLPGVQYVGVPEFQDVGTRCTELFSAVIADSMSIDDALADCQIIASEASA
ncbi:MAG: extracellular solute-binding protein [Ilumatobacter sp.]|uniref:ABC transporter substrate-binding protein n=1 Tax=Ilumatobacter sp. TaxID=1967498 RepID=UPI003C779BBC